MLDADGNLTEFGIDPDVPVSITSDDLLRGVDTILESALTFLLEEEHQSEKSRHESKQL